MPISYGMEYMKLINYGIQRSINVFEKCPNIADTAKTIPDQ